MNLTKEAISNTTIDSLSPGIGVFTLSPEDQDLLFALRDECSEYLRGRLREIMWAKG